MTAGGADEAARRGFGVQDLESAMGSPLRLRLVAELMEAEPASLTIEELTRRSGRHQQDVVACLLPMTRWGVLDKLEAGRRFQISRRIDPEMRAALLRVVERRGDLVERERRVRGQVLCGMIGVDPKMLMVFEMIHQIARVDVPVLVTGETGTGKELVARAVHELSGRRARTFGEVNCATLTEELFASEMFGHVKGSFTGAVKDHVGLVERCDGGTLFLDEVGDLSVPNQVKLLRVLQEHTFTRVGDERVRRSDFRIICATNRPLGDMVTRGEFREDLYYRLNVFPLQIPSLRERPADLPYLVEELLASKLREYWRGGPRPELTERAMAALRSHTWPGNVRELENVLMRALIVAGGQTIDVMHLPPLSGGGGAPGQVVESGGPARLSTLAEVERRHIERVLQATKANISRAAATLAISRTTLYKKIRDYGIDLDTIVG